MDLGYELVDNSKGQRHSKLRFAGLMVLIFVVSAVLTFTFLTSSVRYGYDTVHNRSFRNYVPEMLKQRQNVGNTNSSAENVLRLVCYYSAPNRKNNVQDLRLADVNANLCTHIHIGPADVYNSTLVLSDDLAFVLNTEVPILRAANSELKVLLWVGGGSAGYGFPAMVKNHTTRKVFIGSLKYALRQYSLDGIDLDWEFPSAYNKERQHFSQLLYEIKQEYRREKRDYLLSVAVAAPEGIALFAYDVGEINKYADYANLMTYDYHFYTPQTPFTGLNAPLYARYNERSIMATFNINYSVNWWLAQGIEPNKLVVGLPTYGHSFTLVNPFNKKINAPASANGQCGSKGFTSYSDVCSFIANNVGISMFYDQETCSPYLSSGSEWISYENETSLECKARFVKSKNLGGIMAYSLNMDDFKNNCNRLNFTGEIKTKLNATFPLLEAVKRVLSS